jgi:hypothetical protein
MTDAQGPMPDAHTNERQRPSVQETKTATRLLILWFAVAFVVWNGVYDMRMHDAARGYLAEAALAQAGIGRGVDMRAAMHRGLIDAVAFSTAWGCGVLLAGLVTVRAAVNHKMPNAEC